MSKLDQLRAMREANAVKRGRPRIEETANTLKARKPWKALGMSRRTWERRQAEAKENKP